jgi:hypothetical protein
MPQRFETSSEQSDADRLSCQRYAGHAGTRRRLAPEFAQRSDYDLWQDLGRRLGQAGDWPATVEEFWDTLARPGRLTFDKRAAYVGPLPGPDARASVKSRDVV